MEKKLERFIRIKNELGWYCKQEGEVFNKSGKLLGADSDGYLVSKVVEDGKLKKVYLHQYVWFYFNGVLPNIIDHINGNKKDNSLKNLRNVTAQQNQFNRLSAKGYYFCKNKWRAMIRINNKLIHLGYFFTEIEARMAYLAAKKIYHIYE